MSNIYGLLNLSRDILDNFALQGRLIENNVETDRILRNASRKLKAIEDRMQDDGKRPNFDQQSIEEVIKKVKHETNGTNMVWTIKELRLVSYYMVRFCNEQKVFNHALQLLENNWKDMFINGLLFFLMNSWNICSGNLLISATDVIKRHIINYNGTIKRYLILKKQIDLLEKAGPTRLATLLIAQNIPLDEAPTILGYKKSALSFSYFSDVIITYFKRKQEWDYEKMELIFKKHSFDRTKKMLFSYLIEKTDESGNAILQDNVSRAARRCLGDITLSTTWSPFAGATSEEERQLKKAKELVIAWGARKVVEAFFDVCQDTRRRKYWLDYIPSITDFRVVGSTSIRTQLASNPEVASHLRNCFIETNSRVSTTAALVLFIKDKVFVEFSDVGAMYIYNSTNRMIKDIKNKKYIDSTADLKNTNIGVAIESISSWNYYFYDEGKITHRGEWEDRFRRWMRNKMGITRGQKAKYEIPQTIDSSTDNIKNTINSSIHSSHNSNFIAQNKKVTQLSLFDEDPVFSDNGNSECYMTPSCVQPKGKLVRSKQVFTDTTAQIVATDKAFYLYTNRYYFICEHDCPTTNGLRILLNKSNIQTSGGSFIAIQSFNSISTKIGILYKLNDISEIQFYIYKTKKTIRIKTD